MSEAKCIRLVIPRALASDLSAYLDSGVANSGVEGIDVQRPSVQGQSPELEALTHVLVAFGGGAGVAAVLGVLAKLLNDYMRTRLGDVSLQKEDGSRITITNLPRDELVELLHRCTNEQS